MIKFNIFQKNHKNKVYYTWGLNKIQTIRWINNVAFSLLNRYRNNANRKILENLYIEICFQPNQSFSKNQVYFLSANNS